MRKIILSWAIVWVFFAVNAGGASSSSGLEPNEALGVRLAPGFKITQFSDETLANDIYAMTLDNYGRAVVTGRGYIKTLVDINGDGVADEAKLFARTESGGMGLCFDGPYLYFVGDGYLSRFRDQDGNAVADGPPEHLMRAAASEHGGHAMRKGPDGYWYFIGGNDSGFTSTNATDVHSPVTRPEAGCLLRLSPDGKNSEILLHGLRNPYDFDFNWQGDIFTYDSDVEADYFLPWYTPTRLYQLGYGSHHGWRLHGWTRSWKRPDYYLDTVDVLAPMGRGSPTGVVCYRHGQFPQHYRNGLFVLDWTFGRIFFCPLKQDGGSYQTQPELFLEPIGTQGFAPTDVVVAPDGSLLVSIGGRKTRGGVYRIQFPAGLRGSDTKSRSDLRMVLEAPQPLDAWSRAKWVPIAQRVGKTNFWDVVINESAAPPDRIRAIEVLTELFGGLPGSRALLAARAASPQVRARVAWSLGRAPCEDFAFILGMLAEDPHPQVRRCAMEALADHAQEISDEILTRGLSASLGFRDKRVRQAAARLASLLPDTVWQRLESGIANGSAAARMTAALVDLWRASKSPLGSMIACSVVLERNREAPLRLDAVRVAILALGDWHLQNPGVEVNTGYEAAFPLPAELGPLLRVVMSCRAGFPSGNEALDFEMSRLFAMVQDSSSETTAKVANQITATSSATSDFHYLAVLSRLPGLWPEGFASRIASAVVDLDRKLGGEELRNNRNWSARLAEVVRAFCERRPEFAFELLRQPGFPTASHVGLTAAFPTDGRMVAARAYAGEIQKDPKFPWSGPLIELIGMLPKAESFPLLRSQWNNLALREPILLELAKEPEKEDAERFWAGADSRDSHVVQVCLDALGRLDPDSSPAHLGVLIRLLERSLAVPAQREMRASILFLIDRGSGQEFVVNEGQGAGEAVLRKQFQPVIDWFEKSHPGVGGPSAGKNDPEIIRLRELLKTVNWAEGSEERGAALFRTRGCETCHAGAGALGPDLAGSAARMSRDDLFTAILDPSKDVAPNYRTTLFQMRDGGSFTGLIAFESADGVIVQTAAATTVRLSSTDIVSREESDRSLMPDGLLAGCTARDLGDLYRYLRGLGGEGRSAQR